MGDIIDKKGVINLAELSKLNGKTEFENAKVIIEFLAIKAEFYDTPETVQLVFKEK